MPLADAPDVRPHGKAFRYVLLTAQPPDDLNSVGVQALFVAAGGGGAAAPSARALSMQRWAVRGAHVHVRAADDGARVRERRAPLAESYSEGKETAVRKVRRRAAWRGAQVASRLSGSEVLEMIEAHGASGGAGVPRPPRRAMTPPRKPATLRSRPAAACGGCCSASPCPPPGDVQRRPRRGALLPAAY